MSNERSHGNALVVFAVAVMVAIVLAAVTTLKQVDIGTANHEAAPGTMGLAKARPPLDRAPGQPLTTGSALSASPDNRK